MSLAKRLEQAVRERQATEEQVDEVLRPRMEVWTGREAGGQMLMCYGVPVDNGNYHNTETPPGAMIVQDPVTRSAEGQIGPPARRSAMGGPMDDGPGLIP